MKYVRKRMVIDAYLIGGSEPVPDWVMKAFDQGVFQILTGHKLVTGKKTREDLVAIFAHPLTKLLLHDPEGMKDCVKGEWLIREKQGRVHFYDAAAFEDAYEEFESKQTEDRRQIMESAREFMLNGLYTQLRKTLKLQGVRAFGPNPPDTGSGRLQKILDEDKIKDLYLKIRDIEKN